MHLISGTLFIIASMMMIVVNSILLNVYYNQNSPIVILFGVVFLLLGVLYTYLHFDNNKGINN